MAVAALGLAAAAGPAEETGKPAPARSDEGVTEIQLLGVNDFHGHLESPKSVPRVPGGQPVALGGAANLHAHLDRAERSHPGRTIRVHAGDMVGASPLLSSHYHDEPSVRAMNLMRFDVGTVGNHEFDEGGDELSRLLRGGRRQDAGRLKRDAGGRLRNTSAPDFEGVSFPYTAANTVDREGRLGLPPTRVIERDGVRIGFIGVTTPSTPEFVLPRHADRFRFLDISDSVNRHAADLRRAGVEAIVVLAHSGAYHANGDSGAASGEIVAEAREMSAAVDVVIAGHTHSHLHTRVPNAEDGGHKLVIQANSFGIAYDRVRMSVDRRSGEVVAKSGDTPPTWADEVQPHPSTAALVERHARRLAPLSERVIGRARRPLLRNRPHTDSGSIGAVAARAQMRLARADLAFVNEGNSRGDLTQGPITYGQLFRASAYEHQVLRLKLTGAQIRAVLREQYDRAGGEVPLHLAGIRYRREGERVAGVQLSGGRTLQDGRRYVVAANELLVRRGGFATLSANAAGGRAVGTDLDALVAYVEARGSVG